MLKLSHYIRQGRYPSSQFTHVTLLLSRADRSRKFGPAVISLSSRFFSYYILNSFSANLSQRAHCQNAQFILASQFSWPDSTVSPLPLLSCALFPPLFHIFINPISSALCKCHKQQTPMNPLLDLQIQLNLPHHSLNPPLLSTKSQLNSRNVFQPLTTLFKPLLTLKTRTNSPSPSFLPSRTTPYMPTSLLIEIWLQSAV